MIRLPGSPLVERALIIAERHLGIEALAQRLDAPIPLLQSWRLGHVQMPEDKFLLLADLLNEIDASWAGRDPTT